MSTESTDRLHALAAARQILNENPGATPMQVAAIAWLQGRIDLCRELRPTLNEPAGMYDNSFTCQRCGRKVAAASSAPASMAAQYVCFHCSAGDEPRAA